MCINKLSVKLLFALLAVITVKPGFAQLCQGSLGDPVVNITFGSGANPGPQLNAATTSYQFYGSDCPGDGFYTVRNNTANCFSSSWYSVNRDHTGDANGYFMLVNASEQPSAFYVDTVRGLCSNTTFEFAAWIMNVLLPSACSPDPRQPNLTFTIEKSDGTILQTYQTGTIPSEQSALWKQYGFFFNTPPGVTDIVLRIFNNAPGGCGNDLALDDITFRPCGPQLTPSISGTAMLIDTLCNNLSKTYTFNCGVSAGFNSPSYQWQQSVAGAAFTDIPGANGLTYTKNFPVGTAPATYQYRLTAAEAGNLASEKCRISSQPLTVQVGALPAISFVTNSPVCQNDTFVITYQPTPEQYTAILSGPGFNGRSNCCDPGAITSVVNVQPAAAGNYTLDVISRYGCAISRQFSLTVIPAPQIVISQGAAVCSGNSIGLLASGGIAYEWTPAASLSNATMANPAATPQADTRYTVKVTNQQGCSDTASVKITVNIPPTANAGPDKVILAGGSTQLEGGYTGSSVTLQWNPAIYLNDPGSVTPVATPPVDYDYTLTVRDNLGCGIATDMVHVKVFKDFFVPNAFTPNDDGKNDLWDIPALHAFTDYTVSIFNRSGQLLYRADGNYQPWNGTYKGAMQPTGVYTYVIDLKQSKRIFKGTLLIIR